MFTCCLHTPEIWETENKQDDTQSLCLQHAFLTPVDSSNDMQTDTF